MLHDGRIAWSGPTEDLRDADEPEVQRFLNSRSGRSGDMAA